MSKQTPVTIRLFAVLRDRAGAPELRLELPLPSSVKELMHRIGQAHPELAPLLPAVRLAVNEEFVDPEGQVQPGDRLALIPPVSGGEEIPRWRLVDRPVESGEVEAMVRGPRAGAVVSFLGTVRDHNEGQEVSSLHYEAYPEMVEKVLKKIVEEVEAQWPESVAAIVHRYGTLAIGEVSVAIAVSHPHRAQAFEGCRHAIERLKQDVPIWKREERTDGSTWIGVGS